VVSEDEIAIVVWGVVAIACVVLGR